MAGIACGIIGLPNVGKSTLFNALTRAGARADNYPFCTIDPNVAVVHVPEPRLERLNAVEQRPQAIPPVIEFVDIAGLVKGASHGEGRGNEFLQHIHHVDLLVHVVRTFRDGNVVHVHPEPDPADDIQTINLELALADLQTADRAIERYARRARGRDRDAARAVNVLERIRQHLDAGNPLRTLGLASEDLLAIPDCRFLTLKPVLYVPNVDEESLPDMEGSLVAEVRELAGAEGAGVLPICASMEAEIAELPPAEACEFVQDMGLQEDALSRLITTCYTQLGLITFLTVGDEEVRAWTIPAGAAAPEAGGRIHSDFHDHFIRVEVIAFEDFDRDGCRHAAREHGHMRIEGKDYVVADGDILFFRIGQ